MKIQIPPHAPIQMNPNSDETTTPFEFVRHFMLAQLLALPDWGKDMPGIYAAMEMRGLFKGKVPGDVVDLTNDQGARLQKVLTDNPTVGLNVPVIIQCGSYLDAVLKPLEK